MKLRFSTAIQSDAPELAALHTAANEDLTKRFGHGLWSSIATEKGVLFAIRNKHMLVARKGKRIVGTRSSSKQRSLWAIDVSYFTPVKKSLLPNRHGHASRDARTRSRPRTPRRSNQDRAHMASRRYPPRRVGCRRRRGPVLRQMRLPAKWAHVTYKTTPLIYFELFL